MTFQRFDAPIPPAWLRDPSVAEFAQRLLLWIDDIQRDTGVLDTTNETVSYITVTGDVDLDAVAADTATNTTTLNTLLDSSPTYTVTNGTTDRTLNANDAAGTISNPVGQAEVENIRDAVLDHADTLATLIGDLQSKNVLG